jgi:hypothetical protein
MKHLARRIVAASIDWILISAVQFVLAFGVYTLKYGFIWEFNDPSGMQSICLGIHCYTNGSLLMLFGYLIPGITYYYFMETSRWNATLGKKLLRIKVSAEAHTNRSILIRTSLKLVPTALNYVSLHFANFYGLSRIENPDWIYILDATVWGIYIIYGFSMVASKGQGSLYDRIAGTTIEKAQ